MKKILSLLLAVVMVIGMLPAGAIFASAAETKTYEKVTTAPTDWSGTYLIVYEDESFIFDGSLSTLDATNNYQTVTISDNKIDADPAYQFVIASMAGGYSIQAASGQYIGHGSNANALTASATALVNTLSMNDDGSVNIICGGGAYLRFNTTSGQDRFRYYKSSSYTSQKAICLYKLVEGDSGSVPECEHPNATTTTTDATCTEVGSKVVTCPDCTYEETTELPMVDHNYVNGACTVCGEKEPAEENFLLTTALSQNDQVVIYYPKDSLAMTATADGSRLKGTAATVTDGILTVTGDMAVMQVEFVDDTNFRLVCDGKYLTSGATGYSLSFADTANEYSIWYLETADEDKVYIHSLNAQYNGKGQSLEIYSSNFTTYGTGTTDYYKFQLFVKAGDHLHDWTEWSIDAKATCTEAGAQSRTCQVEGCNEVQNAVIPALGHDYSVVVEVVAPTVTEQGYTIYSCANGCNTTENRDYVEALGEDYTVSFVVPEGVAAIEDMSCNTSGIILPVAEDVSGVYEYTFVGWSDAPVENVTDAPVIYTGEYVATADTTLYAIYSYAVSDAGVKYELVTRDNQLKVGATVIIANSDASYAMSTNQKTGNRGAVAITKNDDGTIEYIEDIQLVILEDGVTDGTYALKVGEQYLYAASSSENQLKSQASKNENASWMISVSDSGAASIIAQGENTRNVMRYNPNNGTPLFNCYASTSTTGSLPYLYVAVAMGTYYTSSFAGIQEPVAEIHNADGFIAGYTSIADAMANVGEDQYIVLKDNVVAENAEIMDNLYIDLAGYSLTGTMDNPNECEVFIMDSTTDSYTVGTGIFNVEGIVPVTAWKADAAMIGSIKRYMAIAEEDGGYSAHRFYLGVTHASVKPAVNGVGYKAVVAGDEKVMAQIASFGYSLTLGDNTPVTMTKAGSELVSGKAITLRVEDYDVAKYGETDLAVSVSLTLNDGAATVIESAGVSMSLKDMMQKINANAASYTSAQITALKAMYTANEAMKGWNLYNLGGLSDMTAAQIVEAAYTLEKGASMMEETTLTGVITAVTEKYSEQYKNATVTIVVDGMEENPIVCYRMKTGDADASLVEETSVGATITVTGTLMNYNGTIEFGTGCTLDSYVQATTESTESTEV